jgi:hypothetical protein
MVEDAAARVEWALDYSEPEAASGSYFGGVMSSFRWAVPPKLAPTAAMKFAGEMAVAPAHATS